MFDPYLEQLHKSIRDHGGSPLDLPEDFKQFIGIKKKAIIRSWLWDVPGFRRWRVTRLDAGDNIQVLNSVAYPNFNKDKPIMGIDLLWFDKRKKLVAILDFQPLIQDQLYFDKYFDDLRKLQKRFEQFNNQNEMFSYDPKQYFSPWVLFCKGGINEADEKLPIIFNSFLSSYWSLESKESQGSFNLSSKKVEQYQINYDRYSEEKDPAHALFAGFFGKEWSERFIKEFLFPLCLIRN